MFLAFFRHWEKKKKKAEVDSWVKKDFFFKLVFYFFYYFFKAQKGRIFNLINNKYWGGAPNESQTRFSERNARTSRLHIMIYNEYFRRSLVYKTKINHNVFFFMKTISSSILGGGAFSSRDQQRKLYWKKEEKKLSAFQKVV